MKKIPVNSFRDLCFGYKERVRFRGGKMMFHSFEIREKKVRMLLRLMKRELEELSRHFFMSSKRVKPDQGILVVPSLDDDSKAGLLLTISILKMNFEEMVYLSLTYSLV